MRPVLDDLHAVAPDLNQMTRQLGPFSQAAIPALESLGEAGEVGIPAMRDALPVTKDLRRLAKISRPVGKTAGDVLESFKRGRGIERALDYAFYQVAAINGFDSFGHYLRARLILNTCSRYYTEPVAGCSARFAASTTQGSSASAASAADTDPILRRTTAALQGKDPDSVAPLPEADASSSRTAAPAKTAPVRTGTAKPTVGEPDDQETQALMDYLFGKEAE
jgi:hypothetical protein